MFLMFSINEKFWWRMKVKCLRSDNGVEYEPNEFKEFCVVSEICMERF